MYLSKSCSSEYPKRMNRVLQKVNSDTDFEVNLQKIFRKNILENSTGQMVLIVALICRLMVRQLTNLNLTPKRLRGPLWFFKKRIF